MNFLWINRNRILNKKKKNSCLSTSPCHAYKEENNLTLRLSLIPKKIEEKYEGKKIEKKNGKI